MSDSNDSQQSFYSKDSKKYNFQNCGEYLWKNDADDVADDDLWDPSPDGGSSDRRTRSESHKADAGSEVEDWSYMDPTAAAELAAAAAARACKPCGEDFLCPGGHTNYCTYIGCEPDGQHGCTICDEKWAADEKAKFLLDNERKWAVFKKDMYENQRIEKKKKSEEKQKSEEKTAKEAEDREQREYVEHRYQHPDHVVLDALEILTHTDVYCPEACGYHSYNKMKQPLP